MIKKGHRFAVGTHSHPRFVMFSYWFQLKAGSEKTENSLILSPHSLTSLVDVGVLILSLCCFSVVLSHLKLFLH